MLKIRPLPLINIFNRRPPITLFILVLLAIFNIHGALTMPAALDMAPVLRITSNLEDGRMYLGDVIGPFVMGNHLVITCTTDISEAVSLSWWEGGKQLATVASSRDGAVSRSFTVGTLQSQDSQRHFTCRELVSGAEKSVDLHLVDDQMEIQKDGISIDQMEVQKDSISLKYEGKVDVFLGKGINLNCVVNGSNPSTGSWWEGETKLPAKRTKSPKGINSQMVLRPARIEDNGRKLTCLARNGQLTKTVVLNVVEATTGARPTTKPPANATNIPLPATANEVKSYLIAGVAFIVVFGVVVVILIFVIVMMGKKVIKQERSTSQELRNSPEHRSDTSTVETPVSNSLTSLDPHDLPALLSPLLLRPSRLEGGDETESSGGRMSAMKPDDRDHSYYYPGPINNSYYYPKITD